MVPNNNESVVQYFRDFQWHFRCGNCIASHLERTNHIYILRILVERMDPVEARSENDRT